MTLVLTSTQVEGKIKLEAHSKAPTKKLSDEIIIAIGAVGHEEAEPAKDDQPAKRVQVWHAQAGMLAQGNQLGPIMVRVRDDDPNEARKALADALRKAAAELDAAPAIAKG